MTSPHPNLPPKDPMKTWKSPIYRTSREKDREGNGTPLQYSCLANTMEGGAW